MVLTRSHKNTEIFKVQMVWILNVSKVLLLFIYWEWSWWTFWSNKHILMCDACGGCGCAALCLPGFALKTLRRRGGRPRLHNLTLIWNIMIHYYDNDEIDEIFRFLLYWCFFSFFFHYVCSGTSTFCVCQLSSYSTTVIGSMVTNNIYIHIIYTRFFNNFIQTHLFW